MCHRCIFGVNPLPGIPQAESIGRFVCLRDFCVSGASANIPSPRRREEKEPLEQSRPFPCCDLTRKRKQTLPLHGCLTSLLHMILRAAQMVVCSHWTTVSQAPSLASETCNFPLRRMTTVAKAGSAARNAHRMRCIPQQQIKFLEQLRSPTEVGASLDAPSERQLPIPITN